MKKLMLALVLLLPSGMASRLLAQEAYPLPSVPDSISQPSARADWATACFWERFPFGDTTLVKGSYGEEAMNNFLGLLSFASPEGREKAVARWFQLAAKTPASLDHFKSASSLQLRRLMGNGEGTVAADFTFLLPDGTKARLHTTCPDRQLLLVFYDPECEQCQSLLFRLRHNTLLRQAVEEHRMQVLAVCTESQETVWRQTLGELPDTWLKAFDADSEPLPYQLDELPVVFVLDADKRVLLRQPDALQLMQHLNKAIF